jgi:hypothetical protein
MLDSVMGNDRVETHFMLNCDAGGTSMLKNLYLLFPTTWQIIDKNVHSVLMATALRLRGCVVARWKREFNVHVEHPKRDRSRN